MSHRLQLMLPLDKHYVQFKASFLEKFYRSYLEKTSNNVIRLYDKIKVKNDRNGIEYKEEERAKNEARRKLLDELCELGPKYKHHKSEMSDWSLDKELAAKKSRVNELNKLDPSQMKFDMEAQRMDWPLEKIQEEIGKAKKRIEEKAENDDTLD
ncbi:hypothetical protein BpHYR1_017176 [Brachionus plicatilis]|uniref:Uncharacterized protein n=1 Tax=Brachionus plicatilis TaxID=10195 RepID=A0A3M7PV82_BRAPC|nr:hypothetical protein BpHYR1_017176 [Brachionus plicatilis]